MSPGACDALSDVSGSAMKVSVEDFAARGWKIGRDLAERIRTAEAVMVVPLPRTLPTGLSPDWRRQPPGPAARSFRRPVGWAGDGIRPRSGHLQAVLRRLAGVTASPCLPPLTAGVQAECLGVQAVPPGYPPPLGARRRVN